MKKMKRFKKAAVLLMAAVMCFGMAGCKKTTGGETPTGDVYAPSFSEISSDVEYVTNVLAGDGRLSIMHLHRSSSHWISLREHRRAGSWSWMGIRRMTANRFRSRQ